MSASAIAIVLICTAYAISGPVPFLKTVNAESTHNLLVTYAAKDSDNDGLPDWEEALYGTDPNNPHSVDPTMTDSEAVTSGKVKPKFNTATTTTATNGSDIPGVKAGPETLTDQFAQQFFSQYLSSRSATPPTSAEVASFVQASVQQLKQSQATQDAFNSGQVRVVGQGPDALVQYAADVEKVFAINTVSTTQSEVGYFADAVNKGDDASLIKVKAIGTAYANIARGLMKVAVPKEAAAAHLGLANSMMHLSEVILDLAAIKTDPLRAMVGLASYEDTVRSMVKNLSIINTAFDSEGVIIPQGTPGSSVRGMLEMAAKSSTPNP